MGQETFTKRRKELARQNRRMEKADRLRQRREEKVMGGQQLEDEDPIAGSDLKNPSQGSQPNQ
jgi:transcription initiation factor IIF auxiliary subunit